MIADYEPEDAWDASDAVRDQLINLARRIAVLDGLPEPRTTGNVDHVLTVIHDRLVRAMRARALDERERLRAEQLRDDLAFIRARLP